MLVSMVNPDLLTIISGNTISAILLPLERTLAEGALNLWQCKVVQERKLPHASPDIHRVQVRGKQSSSILSTHIPSRATRLKRSIPLRPSRDTDLSLTLVFPDLSASQMRRITAACKADRSSQSILKVGDIHVYGAYIRQLCGNEDGSIHEGGHLHHHVLQTFICTVIQTTGIVARLLKDDECCLFLNGNIQSISNIRTSSKTNMLSDWIVILLPDKQFKHDIHGNALCLDLVNRAAHYFYVDSLHTQTRDLHKQRAQSLIDIIKSTDAHTWHWTDHHGIGVALADGAVWLGIAIQLLFIGITIPKWSSAYSFPGRKYIASCILEQKCLPGTDMLVVSTVAPDISLSHIPPVQLYSTTMDLTTQLPSYNMLHPNYVYIPCRDGPIPPPIPGDDIVIQSLTAMDTEYLEQWCNTHDDSFLIHDNLFLGEVTAGDIKALLQPTTLSVGMLLHLLYEQYPVGHHSVLIMDQAIMEIITRRHWTTAYQDQTEPAHNSIQEFLRNFGTKEWIVVLYCDNTHFTSHIVHCNCQVNGDSINYYGSISYLDSFLDKGTNRTDLLKEFLDWACFHYSHKINSTKWDVVHNPTGSMIRQAIYLAPGQHSDVRTHIDCGLYAYFMILQLLSGGRVDGFSSEGIHLARPVLALFLTRRTQVPGILYWTGAKSIATLPVSVDTTILDHQVDKVIVLPTYDIGPESDRLVRTDPIRSRPLLTRAAKTQINTDLNNPIPVGRKVHSVDIHTYVADSTITDKEQGIDAGWGLFASRPFDPDSPFVDNDLVAYYTGSTLTESEMDNIVAQPDPQRTTGFILHFQGIIIDGWDHINHRHHGVASVINDFLDERNNCQPSKEWVPNMNKKKAGSYRIAI